MVGQCTGGQVAFVDGDVKAGLVGLLFDVELACLLEGHKPEPEPAQLLPAQALLGKIDGGSADMGADVSPWAGAALPLVCIRLFWNSTVRTAELTSSGEWKTAAWARARSARKVAVQERQ